MERLTSSGSILSHGKKVDPALRNKKGECPIYQEAAGQLGKEETSSHTPMRALATGMRRRDQHYSTKSIRRVSKCITLSSLVSELRKSFS